MRPRIRRFRRFSRLVLAAALGLPLASSAYAGKIEDIGKKLRNNQGEVARIAQGIQQPSRVGHGKTDESVSRKLIDAQVQFGMGNYEDASVLLYDIVEAHPNHTSQNEAMYYLAEALFQKGDNLASRAYFRKLATQCNGCKFYQQALERLIELSLRLQDPEGVQSWLSALDGLPASKRLPSVPYVRGKYAYFGGDFDQAIRFFTQVAKTSKYSLQAQYFIGAAYIAKRDLGAAAKTFGALVKRAPRSAGDRRVIELAHMAIGRLHYERDQPSKAIDSYLNVSRKSDLFDDVLYEVAWVYVKNKEYPKALRALELLELTDPKSSRMPEVRILEGNLRIRKAQTQYDRGTGNPVEEYDKALKVFTETRESYDAPHERLNALLAEKSDPAQFMAQITGREAKTFETEAELPEVAAAWLREEPDVQTMIGIETDLGDIERYVEDAEQTIRRLELAISTDARIDIFPELAERRYRILDIREETDSARGQLLADLEARTRKVLSAEEVATMHGLTETRQRLRGELDELSGKESATARAKAAKGKFTSVDQQASELHVVIESIEAEVVALEQYIGSAKDLPKNSTEIKTKLGQERAEVATMRDELEQLREDTRIGRDAAGASADAAREKQLRAELRANLDAQARFVTSITGKMSGDDRRKADQILALLRTADATTEQTDAVLDKIDAVADAALVDVRQAVDEERAKLASYKREFTSYDTESSGLGSEVLEGAFGEVAAKFRDVLMRSDVGIVDVSWSHKESNERLRRRLVLDRARERKTLDSEFADVIEELSATEEREAAKKAGGNP